jgi:hypothetical protein
MSLGMAAVTGAYHTESLHPPGILSLQFKKPHFLEEFQSGEIQPLSGPCIFSKYLLPHPKVHLEILAL